MKKVFIRPTYINIRKPEALLTKKAKRYFTYEETKCPNVFKREIYKTISQTNILQSFQKAGRNFYKEGDRILLRRVEGLLIRKLKIPGTYYTKMFS